MPLYEYECDACGQRVEVIQKFSDPPPEACTRCGKGPMSRMASSPAIQFKGSGFYINDYAQKGKSDSSATSGKTEKSDKADSKTDSKAESKTESKTETKSDAAPAASSTPPSSAKS